MTEARKLDARRTRIKEGIKDFITFKGSDLLEMKISLQRLIFYLTKQNGRDLSATAFQKALDKELKGKLEGKVAITPDNAKEIIDRIAIYIEELSYYLSVKQGLKEKELLRKSAEKLAREKKLL
jgi:hypothetical protein